MPLRAKLRHDGVASCSLVPLRTGGDRPPIVLTDPSVVIGSGNAAQIRLKSSSVSKAHALILVEDGKAYVRDLASRTYLYVNDAPVREAFVGEGDVVRVGRFGFGVHENAAARARPHDPVTPTVRLRIGDSGAERVLAGRVVLIGRRHGCDVIVPDHTLSGAHAVLFHVRGQWWVRDLGSRAATVVNGAEVRQQRALSAGDVLNLGSAEVVFLGAAGSGTAEADVAPGPVGVAQPPPFQGPGEVAGSMAVAEAAPMMSTLPEIANAPQVGPVEEPASPVDARENDSTRPSVFASAPIGNPHSEAAAAGAPSESTPQAEAPPTSPGGNGWEERPISVGEPDEEQGAVDGGVGAEDPDDEDVGDEPEDGGSSGALATQPASDKEWDEAVTVWSFAELAKRGQGQSSRDDARVGAGAAASDRRRWLWVTVGAAIACVAVLATLMAHKLW